MKTILEELFYGNINPETDCRSNTKESRQLMGYIADHHDSLLETLDDKQKELLKKFDDCHSELLDINERNIFKSAFTLGARIMLEILHEKNLNNFMATISRMVPFVFLADCKSIGFFIR